MTRNLIASVLAAIFISVAAVSLAAQAQDSVADSAASTNKVIASAGKSSKSSASLPKKFVGFFVTWFFGTPVCVVRQSIDEDKSLINGTMSGSKNPLLMVPTVLVWSPFAAAIGTMEAPFFALDNSCTYSDEPFSKNQFSLGNGK